MRLSRYLVPVLAFLVAGLLSGLGARVAVSAVESRSADGVADALRDEGIEWATVLADGLQVIIEGEAPSESIRFRSMSVAGTVVDASRVIDNMTVAESAAHAPPDFTMEILRNDSGISMIGLVPASTDRDALTEQIVRVASGKEVVDLLEVADYPVPDGWDAAMDYGLDVLNRLPRSKISVMAGYVDVTAIADSDPERRRLEAELSRRVPEGLRIGLSISAPRPVITPFTTRFILDADGARFDTCAADTELAAGRIIAAARAAGLEGKGDCTVALGVPSATWGLAVVQSIRALEELGGGTVTVADADISLVGLEGTAQGLFDRVVGELENELPDLFVLDASLPRTAETGLDGPPQFTATLSPEGLVQLRGRVADPLMNTTAENYARARFGSASITMGTRLSDDLPADWSIRILAAIEALSNLSNGAVIVEPTRLEITGKTGTQGAGAEISRLLIERLGQTAAFDVNVTYVPELDPIAALPTPEECIDKIVGVTEGRKITFDPSSAVLAGDAQLVMDDIAEILQRCSELKIEVAGFTDSQGSEGGNLRLSQERADAVLTALRERRVPVSTYTAIGYGEADPIADNETEEGREANRRIEFRLIRPAPLVEEPTALEQLEAEAAAAAETGGAEEAEATDPEATAETEDIDH